MTLDHTSEASTESSPEPRPKSKPALRAYALLTCTTLCWGANAVFGRLAVNGVSPLLLVSLRWCGVLLLLAVFARQPLLREWQALRPRLWYTALLGVLGFTGFNALFYLAAHSTTAVNIGILQGSVPVLVLLGSFFLYGTPIKKRQILGVSLTLAGVVIVACGGQPSRLASLSINLGDGLMILACVLYAGYALGLQRRPHVSALALFTVMAIAALIASLPLTVAEAALHQLQWPTPRGWVIVSLIAVFPSFLAQVFFIQSVEMIGPGRAGIFVNLVPIFAASLAILVLAENFAGFHAVALGLVLVGIWISERR